MANSNEQTPAPAGADAGSQSGAEGAGGEPKGTRLQAQGHDRPAPDLGEGQQKSLPARTGRLCLEQDQNLYCADRLSRLP